MFFIGDFYDNITHNIPQILTSEQEKVNIKNGIITFNVNKTSASEHKIYQNEKKIKKSLKSKKTYKKLLIF